jgi:hypothetical protein
MNVSTLGANDAPGAGKRGQTRLGASPPAHPAQGGFPLARMCFLE